MRIIILSLLLVSLLISCADKKNQIIISGKITSKDSDINNTVVTYNNFSLTSEKVIDTVTVDANGKFEIILDKPNLVFVSIHTDNDTISKALVLPLLEYGKSKVNLELDGPDIISKEFYGNNAEDLKYADAELQDVFGKHSNLMSKYIKIEKEQRLAEMPDVRKILESRQKNAFEDFNTETLFYKKQIQCFKNIHYSYLITITDIYDDIKTEMPYALQAQEIFEFLPATSPLWSENMQIPIWIASNYKFLHSIKGYTIDLKENMEFLRKLVVEHPNNDVAGYAISYSISTFLMDNEIELVNEFAGYFKERDVYSEYVKNGFKIFSPDRKIKTGEQVPEFSFPSLSDSTVVYTNDYFKGKIYLIDFWATWCKPCMIEMPSLHEAYKKYKDVNNFEILSISFDTSPVFVKNFREKHWPMPWSHTLLVNGKKSPEAIAFEAHFIPKMLLVDGNTNTIIAETFHIKGGNLENVLDEYFKID